MPRLHDLLIQRARALAVPRETLERALRRCARSAARSVSGPLPSLDDASGRFRLATPTPPAVVEPPPQPAAITVPSLNEAPPPPPPRDGLVPGRVLAGYRIEGQLGKGGMGAVYRATQLSMNRQVAFKVLAPRLSADATFVGRFKREARAAGRLHHPNLITVHDWGESEGILFFSMELVQGESLKDLLRRRGPLPADEALGHLRQALEALRYAHGQGLVHRDIKPDNLMLDHNGLVKIADLGLSRIETSDTADTAQTDLFQTAVGSFMGTPHYMPPEQARDAHEADARSDLYSLGATAYHLLTGGTPFTGATPMAVLVAVQSQPVTWPAEPVVPLPVRQWVERLMAKDPARRPPDAQAALDLLARLTAQPAAAPRRHRWLWWLGGLVVGVALTIGVLLTLAERQRRQTWKDGLATIDAAIAGQRFSEGRDRIERLREHPLAQRRDDELQLRSTALDTAWDAWALEQAGPTLAQIRADIDAHRCDEARRRIDTITPAWRRPPVERRLGELEAALEAERARPKPTPEPPAARPLPGENITAHLAKKLGIPLPPGQNDIQLSGRGTRTLDLPPDVRLRIVFPATAPASAGLTLSVGQLLRCQILPDGRILAPNGMSLPAVAPNTAILTTRQWVERWHQLDQQRPLLGRRDRPDPVLSWDLPDGCIVRITAWR